MMELVDFNENMLGDKQTKGKPARKRRSTGKKKTEDIAVASTKAKKTETDEVSAEGETESETIEKSKDIKDETEKPAADETTDNTKEESNN